RASLNPFWRAPDTTAVCRCLHFIDKGRQQVNSACDRCVLPLAVREKTSPERIEAAGEYATLMWWNGIRATWHADEVELVCSQKACTVPLRCPSSSTASRTPPSSRSSARAAWAGTSTARPK